MPARETEVLAVELPADLLAQIDRAVRRRQQAIRNEPTTRQTIIRNALREHFAAEHDERRARRSFVPHHATFFRSE